ncbi:MAG TPA: DUF1801 domain-containing protein [Saprospiraceae bacterium]|nr:DUF1801 domain-containing protein [Saprospiraceae bacterium]
MNPDIQSYNDSQSDEEREICNMLAKIIFENLIGAENKIWHAHPVWFIDGNPVVGYSKLKGGIRLLFWSGQSFDEDTLIAEGSFKAAEIRFNSCDQINKIDMKRYLEKAIKIQWDYKNLIKRKGNLERLV